MGNDGKTDEWTDIPCYSEKDLVLIIGFNFELKLWNAFLVPINTRYNHQLLGTHTHSSVESRKFVLSGELEIQMTRAWQIFEFTQMQ